MQKGYQEIVITHDGCNIKIPELGISFMIATENLAKAIKDSCEQGESYSLINGKFVKNIDPQSN